MPGLEIFTGIKEVGAGVLKMCGYTYETLYIFGAASNNWLFRNAEDLKEQCLAARLDQGSSLRMLLTDAREDALKYKKDNNSKKLKREVAWIDLDYKNNLTFFHDSGHHVYFVDFKEGRPPSGLLIKDERIAHAQRVQFETLWKQADGLGKPKPFANFPRVKIAVGGTISSTNQLQDALIDTGFNGFASIPTNTALKLGLTLTDRMNGRLANGFKIESFVANGFVKLDNKTVEGPMLLSDGSDVLLGMDFLKRAKININCN